MSKSTSARTVLLCSAVALLLAACSGRSPEEQVSWLRGMYSAELKGFLVQQEPAPEPEMAPEEGAEAEAPAAEEMAVEGEGEMVEPMEAEPATVDILLDVLIKHDAPELLPGITVDVVMVDADKADKASWKVFFDTSTVKKANPTQYTHLLEDVPYVEGDGFAAEIRHPVPVEERGEYKEFSSAG